jgi:hypothetical protein|tara:strand:+ start:389 stop:565 length:177 start_codon:yes stop_codon:yes gene_type:complete
MSGDYKLDMGVSCEKLWQEYHRGHAKLFMQPTVNPNPNQEGKLADTDTTPPPKAKAKI